MSDIGIKKYSQPYIRRKITVNKVANDQAVNNERQYSRSRTRYVVNMHERPVWRTDGTIKHTLIDGLVAVSMVYPPDQNDPIIEQFTDDCSAAFMLRRARLYAVLMALNLIETDTDAIILVPDRSLIDFIETGVFNETDNQLISQINDRLSTGFVELRSEH